MDKIKAVLSILLLLAVFCFGYGCGMNSEYSIKVSSLEALQNAVNNAKGGDNIILANGSYETTSPITITSQGTESKPVTIAAEHVGGVTITGASGFSIMRPACHVTVKGFVFNHEADSSARIQHGATHCRFTKNVFELTGDIGPYLRVAGNNAEIDYNTFRNKAMEGRMLLVEGPGGEPMAQNVWVHHNLFKNFEDTGRNNSSAIQFGRSWSSLTPAHGLIENNLFLNSHRENENVGHKASNCVIRYNTFDVGSSELSLRHGNHNEVYGNFFFDTEGVRIFGDDHRIYSNYLEGNSRGIHLRNGRAEVAEGAVLTTHGRPDRNEIVYNTLIDNQQNFYMGGGRDGGLGATHTTIANNIIQGGGPSVDFNGPNSSASWEGNIVWNTGGLGEIPGEGYRSVDPVLSKKDSVYHIQEESPAVDSSTGSYRYVETDMDGQKRVEKLEVGADETSIEPKAHHPLTMDDIGLGALEN